MLLNKKTLFSVATVLSSALSAHAQQAQQAAQEATAPADSAVVKLTTDNFEEFIKENPLVLAEFFAPWCGHCKHLAPEYIKAASELEDKNIPLAQIDCTEDQELCMKMDIPGYPTLKVFKNHDLANPKDYQGARTADSIISFMVKQSLPDVTVVSTEDQLTDLLTNATEPIVVDSGLPGLNKSFYQIAGRLSSEYIFLSYTAENSSTSSSSLALYLSLIHI